MTPYVRVFAQLLFVFLVVWEGQTETTVPSEATLPPETPTSSTLPPETPPSSTLPPETPTSSTLPPKTPTSSTLPPETPPPSTTSTSTSNTTTNTTLLTTSNTPPITTAATTTPTPPPISGTTTLAPPACEPPCPENAECVPGSDGLGPTCRCLTGFSGPDCASEDFCVTMPCPPAQQCRNSSTGRSCFCLGDFKGDNCSEVDVLVQCMDERVTFFLENPPGNFCLDALPSEGDMCYDPSEALVYRAENATGYIRVVEGPPGQFCLGATPNSSEPTRPRECVEILAHEADDQFIRPWRNASASVCFIFNSPPTIVFSPPALTYNLAQPTESLLELLASASVSDPNNPFEDWTFEISGVSPETLRPYFGDVGPDVFLLANEAERETLVGLAANVTLTVFDGGTPELSSSAHFEVTFTKVTLNCSVTPTPPIFVNLDRTTSDIIATVACQGYTVDQLNMTKISSDPFSLTSAGNLVRGDVGAGSQIWSVAVQVSVTDPVPTSTEVTFPVQIGYFNPRCPNLTTISVDETQPRDTCRQLTVCQDGLDIAVTCSLLADSFNMTCSRSETGEIQVQLCFPGSLQGYVGIFTLNGTVSNGVGSHMLSLDVTVIDVNEPPVCTDSTLNVTIRAEAAVGTLVITVSCGDSDVTSLNSALTYTLGPEGNRALDFLQVDSITGAISLANSLANSGVTSLNFGVTATDGGGLTDTIQIDITVSGDYSPVCRDSTVNTRVAEDVLAGACFSVPTECVEPVYGGELQYNLIAGNGTELFRVPQAARSPSPLTVELCAAKNLKQQFFTWQLNLAVASIHGETSLIMFVTVIDINDPPTFVNAPYTATVIDNSPRGMIVQQSTVNDLDLGEFGVVKYSLSGPSALNMLTIDSVTGGIFLSEPLDADILERTYNFTITATDGGGLSATATLTVLIVDVNDNGPVCQAPPDSIDVSLTAVPGTVLYQLQCGDADVTPSFSRQEYSISSASVDVFNVSVAGEVRLKAALWRNTSAYEVSVEARDPDLEATDELAAVSVRLNFRIDTNVPPNCEPLPGRENLRETQPVGFCLTQEVICTDPTGGQVTFDSSQVQGNASRFLALRSHDTSQPNQLAVNPCISSSLQNAFGPYQISAVVTNGLASLSLTWTVNVEDINERPRFSASNYNLSVPENTSTPRAIASISVTDPDINTEAFQLVNVTGTLINDADFPADTNRSVLWVESSRQIYVITEQNATERNVFEFQLRAIDGQGLEATAIAVLHVLDVNEPPQCPSRTLSGRLSLLSPVGAVAADIFCFDTDFYKNNRRLGYQVISGDPDGHFSVEANGQVTLTTPLPRDHPGQQTIGVMVFDHGELQLSTNVTVNLEVNTSIPASCSPQISPPDIWVFDACLRLSMYCQDPTTTSLDHLTYDVTGDYGSNFVVTGITDGVITMCYKNTTDGIFRVSVTVDNGLQTATFERQVQVQYERTTPRFQESQYALRVSENLPALSAIVTFNASTERLLGQLVYSINDEGSTPGWSDYVQLVGDTVSSVASLRPLANTNLVLQAEVMDTGSRLKSSAQVVISVTDVNENPICEILDDDLSLSVSDPVDTMIIQFRCQDNDVVNEYRTLEYSLVGELVTNHFKLVTVQDFREVRVSAPLLVDKSSYRIALTVADGGEPSLRYQRIFNVTIDLTPPRVNIEAMALTPSIIRVRWDYSRADYNTITRGYNVSLIATGAVVRSSTLPSTTKVWNATSLSPETSYSVSVTALTNYGDVSSSVVLARTPPVPVVTVATVSLRWLTGQFDPLLTDVNSQKYYETTQFVRKQVGFVLAENPGYVGATIYTYRPGSVIVDLGIRVNQSGSVYQALGSLQTAVSGGWVGNMSVDSSYFLNSDRVGFLEIDRVETNVTQAHEGADVAIYCYVTAIAYTSAYNISIWWTLNGVRLLPTATSRIQILPTIVELEAARLISTVTVRSVRKSDEGEFECNTREGSLGVKSDVTRLQVIARPVVSLEPRSVTVASGRSVTIVCSLVSPSQEQFQLILYKDGATLTSSPDESVSGNGTSVTLMVTDVRRPVVYGCAGQNVAGLGVRQNTSIWVLEPTEDVVCGEETTADGTVWPVTAPGGVAVAQCGQGSTGEIRRTCNTTGWLAPVQLCVRDTIVTLETQVQQISDGAGSRRVKDVLDDLATVTKPEVGPLTPGELVTSQGILDRVVEISEATEDADETETLFYLEVASNMIDVVNDRTWRTEIEQVGEGAITVAGAVERFLQSTARKQLSQVADDNFVQRYTVNNLYTEVGRGRRSSYEFPNATDPDSPAWVESTRTGIRVPLEALESLTTVEYTSTFYKNLPRILTETLQRDGRVLDVGDELDLNADIVSFKLLDFSETLSPPAVITFQHFNTNYSKPVCCFWDFDLGAWTTEGCSVVSSSEDYTECACNHFTNFAVLMSPGRTPEADMVALSIISAVGCGVSILCIVILLILFALVWRYIRSDRNVLMVHLCVALVISYALFLGGVNRTDNKDACTAISALLHYFYLVVFFLMLGFGVEIGVAVIYVFATKSRLKWILPLAWGIPAVIVGISLGVTRLEGYGNERFCWLSIESGLLWAFVGPAGLVLLINLIIVIVVFRKMFKTSTMLTKTDKEKAKTSLRSLCVLLPILGLTWVFGVFSVNESLVAFQYIFAVCNSLQGLFILLFHGILNKQLHDALRSKRERKRSLATLESSFKPQSSSGQTMFVKDDPRKQSDSSSGLPKGNNPFLEADRQVQEMVRKNKDNKVYGTKLYDNNVKNNLIDKPVTSEGVALEDVKISNILRESEAIAETSGISSILPATTANPKVADKDNRDEDPPRPETSAMRQSTASSHKYDYIEPGEAPKPEGYERLLQPYEKKLSSAYTRLDSDPSRRTGPSSAAERQRADPGEGGAGLQGSREKLDTKTFRSSASKSSRSSRSDDDPEARMKERVDRLHNVYLPEAYRASEAAKQARVAEALPTKYYHPKGSRKDSSKKSHSGKAKDMAAVKKQQQQSKKKSLKDRSKAYQYPYDVAYMGPQSRHSSLENVPMHFSGFNPYAGQGMQHFQQPNQRWDQYQWQPRW